jgi:hypothetical protein
MTVTTEVTTSTDKQLAARYVLNMQHYDNRYHQLTSFENLSHTPHKSFKSNMNKQVLIYTIYFIISNLFKIFNLTLIGG